MAEPTTGFLAVFLASNEGWGKLSFALAGGIGSVISMQFIEGMSKKQRLGAVATGVFLADQFAMPLANGVGANEHAFGVAGMIGLFGFSFVGAMIKGIKQSNFAEWANTIISAIAARISGGK